MEVKSCLPEKLSIFIGRETDVEEIYSLLVKDGTGVVSIVGGPGFGKSTIALQVSHRIVAETCPIIPVIFCYLSNTSNVAEATLRLCLDVGVHPEQDPESSLIFWSRNIEKNVVLVMDNIDKLLEGETTSQFNDLVCMLRKNSNQRLQIITTSRKRVAIPNLSIENVTVMEMDADSSMALLRKSCPDDVELEDSYLLELAGLCGHVPLALCIAASRIQDTDDPNDLITWLTNQPMKALQSLEHHVSKAIEMSFEMLDNEDQKAFARLSVLHGDFDRNAAEKLIDRGGMETQDFLKNLVNRSLMQRVGRERFIIHPLVRLFLEQHLHSERAAAQELMVKHYLKICQSLTLKCYSKDGFNDARKSLKKDAHNIEETLKVSSRVQGTNPNKMESLVIASDIYQSSSRFFYNCVRSFLQPAVMRDFLEFCAGLAKRQKNAAIQINFQCLLADQEGHTSGWYRSSEYKNRMKKIKETFDENEEVLKEDTALLSHFYYSYGRYHCNIDPTELCPQPLKEGDDYLQKSLNLRQNQVSGALEVADEAITLIQLGRLNKRRAKNKYSSNKEEYERFMMCSERSFKQALALANKVLGDHEITCVCHKNLGDLLMNLRKNDVAVEYYENAKKMRKKLRLGPTESLVDLLKNYGACFSYLGRLEKALEQLHEARAIAEKLTDSRSRTHVYCTLARVLNIDKEYQEYQEAKKYAAKALEMKKFLTEANVFRMEQIMDGGRQ